jgi:hypothetical protein
VNVRVREVIEVVPVDIIDVRIAIHIDVIIIECVVTDAVVVEIVIADPVNVVGVANVVEVVGVADRPIAAEVVEAAGIEVVTARSSSCSG